MKTKSSPKTQNIDPDQAAKALEYLFAAGYINKKKLYFANFMRGIFFSLGSVIGATVVIGLIIWVLSLFTNIPLLSDVAQSVRNSLEK